MPTEKEIAALLEENRLLSAVHEKAQMLLLVSMREPVSERLAASLGDLSLAVRANYDWRTERIKASKSSEATK